MKTSATFQDSNDQFNIPDIIKCGKDMGGFANGFVLDQSCLNNFLDRYFDQHGELFGLLKSKGFSTKYK